MKKFFVFLLREGSVIKIRAANEAEARERVKEEIKNWQLSSTIVEGAKCRVVCFIKEIKQIGKREFEISLTPPRLKNPIRARSPKDAIMLVAAYGLPEEFIEDGEIWAEEATV